MGAYILVLGDAELVCKGGHLGFKLRTEESNKEIE